MRVGGKSPVAPTAVERDTRKAGVLWLLGAVLLSAAGCTLFGPAPSSLTVGLYVINETNSEIRIKLHIQAPDGRQRTFQLEVQPYPLRAEQAEGIPPAGSAAKGLVTTLMPGATSLWVEELRTQRTASVELFPDTSPPLSYLITVTNEAISIREEGFPPVLHALFGQVLTAPACPEIRQKGALPCAPRPLQAELALLSEDGKETLGTLVSDENGYFGTDLPAGIYRLHPSAPRPGFPPFPPGDMRIAITMNQQTFVRVLYDSGIR